MASAPTATPPASPEVGIYCPHCSDLTLHPLARVQESCAAGWTCYRCGKKAGYAPAEVDGTELKRCVCGKQDFYRQKDFNKPFGLILAVVAFAASFLLWAFRYGWAAFVVLFGLLGLDLLFYRMTGDITACYACSAYYRGLTAQQAESFDHETEHHVGPVQHLLDEEKKAD